MVPGVPGVPSPQDDAVRAALAASNLAPVSGQVLSSLVSEAVRRGVTAGSSFHRQGDPVPHCELVVTGLARVYVTAPDGRTMTIRYCRSGSLLGLASLFHPAFTLPASIQAVTDLELLVLRPDVLTQVTRRRPEVAQAFLAELSERAMSFLEEIPGGAFATVPQRVARHLLDLASGTQTGSALEVAVGQQELAEAVGSVREVVVRALRDFRDWGLIETGRRQIVIRDPEGLFDEAYDGGNRRHWNQSHRQHTTGPASWRT